MDALKNATGILLDILFQGEATSENTSVGLVPFSGAVNIGSYGSVSAWLDSAGQTTIHKEDLDLGEKTVFDLVAQYPNQTLPANWEGMDNTKFWGGCVRARAGGFDVTDTPPNASQDVETLWSPYFAPDESNGYANNYINTSQGQRNIAKYKNASVNYHGHNYNCVPKPIQPLTKVRSTIDTAISQMSPNGYTVIPQGLVWGWRTISPGIPYIQGAEYDDQLTTKAIIVLTDGRNQVNPGGNGNNKSVFSAYGYAASGRLGNKNGSNANTTLNNKVTDICNNIKANKDDNDEDNDILVYTITFAVGNNDKTLKDLMEGCATDAGKYYDATTTAKLKQDFEKIANELTKLRISK